MGFLGRVKAMVGGGFTPVAALASATTPTIPAVGYTFELTGSTATTELSYDIIRPGREIRLIAKTPTSVVLTDTAIASTAAKKMHLVGGNLTLTDGKSVTLQQQSNGSWWQVASADPG